MSSLQWMGAAEVLCLVTALLAALSGIAHARQVRAPGDGPVTRAPLVSRLVMVVLALGVLATLASLWQKYVEVNHFPSQTMGEVLTVFAFCLLLSMLVLHYAMGLQRRGPGWAILDDALVLVVAFGTYATFSHIQSLPTAQRDLPPALQSYWFSPHIAALIFSYATLAIAGALCLVYFTTRFWSGVFSGGQPRGRQLLILGLLVLVPFAQIVTIPALLLSGLVFLVLKFTNRLPSPGAISGLEREMDQVSFRAFSVGFPFLTAGLFMGAFWAQEAWANYWGWDSKENSALISWLIYVVYVHLRMLGGYRGDKAMAVLAGGALSIFVTFQLFGYLPDSQKSLHRYTDDAAPPMEGQQAAQEQNESARFVVPEVGPEAGAEAGPEAGAAQNSAAGTR